MENSVLPQIQPLKAAFLVLKKKKPPKPRRNNVICFFKYHFLISMEKDFLEMFNKMNGNTHQLCLFIALVLRKLLDFLFSPA